MQSLSSPLLRKCYLKNSPQEKDRWINLLQWRKVLTWAEFPWPSKEMASSDTIKISVISLNSFFSQKRDRRSLVNRSKTETGVIVTLRQRNLTSMCDWRRFTISFLWKSSMHLQMPLVIFSRQRRGKLWGTFLNMETFQIHFDLFSGWFIKRHSLDCLFVLCIQLFQKMLSGRTTNVNCRTAIARLKGNVGIEY